MNYEESEEKKAERLLLESRLNESYLTEINFYLRDEGKAGWHFDTSACIDGYATLMYDNGGPVYPKSLPTTNFTWFVAGALAVIKGQ